MENRRPYTRQGLAEFRADVPRLRQHGQSDRPVNLARHPIQVSVDRLHAAYMADSDLSCVCTIDPRSCLLASVETSVVWITEGKGDQDLGLHYFERQSLSGCADGVQKRIEYSLTTRLPQSPLSYWGEILKINWLVKIVVSATDDTEFQFEFPFRLVGTRSLL